MNKSTSRIGHYIVVEKGEQKAELVGPFKDRNDAEAELELVAERMREVHPQQCEGAEFTVQEISLGVAGPRAGTKNRYLGYRSDLSGWVC